MLTITDQHITIEQACAQLAISRMTLYRWIQAGRLPVTRFGPRCVRLRQTDIDHLADELQDNDRVVIRAAFNLLAQAAAADERPLCPECGRRRMSKTADRCPICQQQRDLQLETKRRWWNAHGNDWRKARKEAARADRQPA